MKRKKNRKLQYKLSSMRWVVVLLIGISCYQNGRGQVMLPPAVDSFQFTTAAKRTIIRSDLHRQIESALSLPLVSYNEAQIAGAFWAMELMLYRPPQMTALLPRYLAVLPNTKPFFQRSFLEMLYTLYPREYAPIVAGMWRKLNGPKQQAMALEYMLQAGISLASIGLENKDLPPHLQALVMYQQTKGRVIAPKDVLDKDFLSGQIIVCSFQYADRNQPGFVRIRTATHEWLKAADGKPFQVPQLARSITNLPSYLTNGNTPQGLYRTGGFAISDISWIGPSYNLQMGMPFEWKDSLFYPTAEKDSVGYAKLLGPLQQYPQLWHSFLAGKLGRTEVIAHGTTIDPKYYEGQSFYPNTPSMGCLCSPELWDANGKLTYSAQREWIQSLQQISDGWGYLLVAEIEAGAK